MISLLLFSLKSLAVLAAALLLTRRTWFTAATRHLILALAIVSLPLMLIIGELSAGAISIDPPGVIQDWRMLVDFPAVDLATTDTASSVSRTAPLPVAALGYGLG